MKYTFACSVCELALRVAMFFWLSKLFWFLIHPLNLIFLCICLVSVFMAFKWYRAAKSILYALVAACILLATVPVGSLVVQVLENRFQINPKLPERIDGIIVLGGIINAPLTLARGLPAMGGGIERISELKVLLEHSPEAKIVFTGGSGDPFNQDLKEAHVAPEVFQRFEINPARVVFEDRSRNTHENATLTYKKLLPKKDENWVLVTSAFHMPRSVGAFRKAGWEVIPYPVDYKTMGRDSFEFGFDFNGGVSEFAAALHECLGLLFYWLTGRTDSLFPPAIR